MCLYNYVREEGHYDTCWWMDIDEMYDGSR